jgi:hypothetical protein
MATGYAYPYKVLADSVAVEILDTEPCVPVEGHRLDLRELAETPGAALRLSVRCSIDPRVLTTVLPPGADPATAAQLSVRERSVGSHLRAIHPQPAGEFDATFEFVFPVDEHFGTVELEPLLILAEDLDGPASCARAAGSVLSWGPTLLLQFDSSEPFSAGGMLEVEWRNFDDDPDLPSEALHTLEIDDRPKLFLNSASPAAYDVLRSEATHGTKARLRDVTFSSIAAEVWTTLVRSSYTALRIQVALEPDAETAEVLAELSDWQRSVLEAWAPLLLGQDDAQLAITELCEAAASNDVDPLSRLDKVLHHQLEPRRRFDKLAEEALGD